MILSDQPRMRRTLHGAEAVLDFPLFQELNARGFTDWFGAVAGFESELMLAQPGSLGMACSWSTAQDGGSELPDQGVISCVVRGFGNLSFPQPEGGIVTVVYPIIFNPGD